jgi:hypothetical protein
MPVVLLFAIAGLVAIIIVSVQLGRALEREDHAKPEE